MSEPLEVRASGQDRNSVCTGSARPPAVKAGSGGEDADQGNANHEIIRKDIGGQWTEPRDTTAVALRYGVSPDQTALLAVLGLQMWKNWLAADFPNPLLEHEMVLNDGDVVLTGKTDVLSYVDYEARIIDWKFGRAIGRHNNQLLAYARLALHERPELESAYVVIAHVQSGDLERSRFTRAQVLEWWELHKKRLLQPADYQPGEYCQWCPHALCCPTKDRWAYQLLNILAGIAKTEQLPSTQPEALAQLWQQAGMAIKLGEKVRELVRAEVNNAGGRLPLADGREIGLYPQTRMEIDYERAQYVLYTERGYEQEDLMSAISVSKTKLEKAIRERAARGQKNEAVDLFRTRLIEVGALREKPTEPRLEVRRTSLPTIPDRRAT